MTYGNVSFCLEVASCVAAAVGVGLNVAALAVILNRRLGLRATLRRLLVTLAAADSGFLLCVSLVLGLIPRWDPYRDGVWPHVVPWLHPISGIFLCSSIWTTVAISIERYLTLCKGRPSQSSAYYLVPIALGSVLYKIPGFFEFRRKTMVAYDVNGTAVVVGHGVTATDLRLDENYVTWWIAVGSFVVTGLVPFCVLAVLNARILRAILEARRKRRKVVCTGDRDVFAKTSSSSGRLNKEELVAVMLMAVVAVFALCHSLRFFLNFTEVVLLLSGHSWIPALNVVVDLSTLLLVLNSAANPVIYYSLYPRFRKCLADMVRCRRYHQPVGQEEEDEETVQGELLQMSNTQDV